MEWLTASNLQSKEELLHFARLAEKAGRYYDATAAMKLVVNNGNELDNEGRNLLTNTYKSIIGSLRHAWRVIADLEVNPDDKTQEKKIAMATRYRLQIEFEIYNITMEVLTLLSDRLIDSVSTPEAKVFYHKMQGDYFRYLAEVSSGEQRKSSVVGSELAYKTALECAEVELPTTHPIRLGVVLNFSIFYYEIKCEVEKACQLSKSAFEVAMADISQLPEESSRDSALIMQLLHDNHGLWSSEQVAEEIFEEPEAG